MRIRDTASALGLLCLAAGCSSKPETPQECVDRFADQSRVIDFLTNETFGAQYTYRFEDGETVEPILESIRNGAASGTHELHIVDGESFLVVRRRLGPDESAIAVGCGEAPLNTMLVNVKRASLTTEGGS